MNFSANVCIIKTFLEVQEISLDNEMKLYHVLTEEKKKTGHILTQHDDSHLDFENLVR